ncbi:MAG: hypothetical protein ACOYN2_05180 [Patescibacteria group bacterium]
MQTSKLFIYCTTSIVLIGILGYLLIDHVLPPSSFKKDDGKISISSSEQHAKTSSDPGDQWGANPFKTGTSSESPKLVFRTPNTQWKSRNITLKDGRTLNYVFGGGNPVGAESFSNEEKSAYDSCIGDAHPNSLICPASGYVTSDIEKSLSTLLSSPSWNILLTCEQDFRSMDTNVGMNDLHYADVMKNGFFDIENWMLVDQVTGRKEIYFRFNQVKNWFISNIYNHSPNLQKPTLKKCFLENGGMSLLRQFLILENKLYTPSGQYADWWMKDPENFIPRD